MKLDADTEALQQFILDNPELEQLEAAIAQFNIFEAVGVIRQELRHSDFLSFLLDPSGNHGLGDAFLRLFLTEVVRTAQSPPLNPVEFDLIHMDEAVVLREWQAVDILIQDPENRIVCVIENKIDTGEHDSQLAKYLTIVRAHYPGWKLLPVFLSPEGNSPSEEDYTPISYGQIAALVDSCLRRRSSTIGEDVQRLLQHYAVMLRRHIVTDSEIADLCRRIYQRHQRAIDLILEHRPDLLQEISDYLTELVKACTGLVLDHCSKSAVRFSPKSWDPVRQLRQGQGWTRSRRVLLFEFRNYNGLLLTLYVGPAPATIREVLFRAAVARPELFRGCGPHQYAKWTPIWRVQILTGEDCEQASLEDLRPKILEAWNHFLTDTLPHLEQAILAVDFNSVPD